MSDSENRFYVAPPRNFFDMTDEEKDSWCLAFVERLWPKLNGTENVAEPPNQDEG